MASLNAAPTARARKGREHRKRVTRRDLLAAGRRLFGDQGLYESSIEDLSRHAGIAKGTLYGYFSSKQELIEAVLSAGLTELLGYTHGEAQGARSNREVVERVIRAHLTFYDENPDLTRIFHQVRGLLLFARPETPRLRRILTDYLRGLAQILALRRPSRRGNADGRLETAMLLFGAVTGIVSTRTALEGAVRSRPDARSTERALVALICDFERPATEPHAPPDRAARGKRRRSES